ncbi:alpha/beta hydrolase [Rhizobium leguminosarum]|uniref:alpha/beta fold hydrolase n=1 Tax=Rhizobium leguminosarum TaxID=384 RepID=UPI000FEC6DEC|nr:alpha/beta hydrolase [Rhizobium leguminosarum]RWX12883.1 alpha/beta hydrolase [Rhizobium leguminosarum]
MTRPTLILVPCLTGAPWAVDELSALREFHRVTLRLDDGRTDVESHAHDVLALARAHAPFVLIGDSFGAQVALAAAIRRPPGLCGLVMSGGFAANPVDDIWTKLKVMSAGLMPGVLYRKIVLPMHADLLASSYDATGEKVWGRAETVALFRRNTSWRGYVARTRATLAADYRRDLGQVDVPTLILTPADDKLIGAEAAGLLRQGIAGAEEVIIPATGHMFRFSHPESYSQAIGAFLSRKGLV